MNGAQFRGGNENLFASADVLLETSNLVISSCCFTDEDKEMDTNEKMCVQSYCFYAINMQICDVLVAVAVVDIAVFIW